MRFVPPALFLLLALAFRPMEWVSDSLAYSRHARLMARGGYEPAGDQLAHRAGLLAPVALCYRLFGETEPSAWLFSLLCGVGLVVVGQSIPSDRRIGFVAGLLLATTPMVVAYSMRLMGDIPVALACALALKWAMGRRPAWAGLALGIGFWIKETTGLVAIFLFGWLLWRRDWRGLGVFAAAAGVPVLVGFALVLADVGNPIGELRRAALPFLEGWRPGDPADLRIHRWTLQFPAAVLAPGSEEFSLMGPLAWAFVGAAVASWSRAGERRFLAASAAAVAALIVWMPASLSPPTPALSPLARYFSIVLAPMAVVVAEARPRAWVVAVLVASGLLPLATRSAVSRARQAERQEVYRMLLERRLESVHFALPAYIDRAADYPGCESIRTVVRPLSESPAGILQVRKGDAPFAEFPGLSVAWEREFAIPPPGREQVKAWLGMAADPGTTIRWRLLEESEK